MGLARARPNYHKSGNFSLYEIFVGKIFVLKIFVGSSYQNISTQKFYNIEVGKNVLPWKSFSKEIAFAATTYIKKYGRRRLERCWCAKENQKLFRSIRCGCEKRRNYDRTFTSKAVAGVFAMGKYTVASVSVECEHVQ